MRVVIIGGSGHVGTYLVPRLVAAGHDVVVVSRGRREPYRAHGAWAAVERCVIDRAEAAGAFGERIRDLRPDVVIDMICFTVESARQLVEALRGSVQHFLHCGTIWVHGASGVVPTTEAATRRPFGDYGIRKAEIEAYLLDEARRTAFHSHADSGWGFRSQRKFRMMGLSCRFLRWVARRIFLVLPGSRLCGWLPFRISPGRGRGRGVERRGGGGLRPPRATCQFSLVSSVGSNGCMHRIHR